MLRQQVVCFTVKTVFVRLSYISVSVIVYTHVVYVAPVSLGLEQHIMPTCLAAALQMCSPTAFHVPYILPFKLPFKLPLMCIATIPVCSSYLSIQSNPEVQDWMTANSLDSLSQLETYFESRVLDLACLAGRSYIVWQVLPFLCFLFLACDLFIMSKVAFIKNHMCLIVLLKFRI